ncbi:MAG: type II secretion system major pseudopilin GspG [Bacteriovoracales bacterium]|nr:type II secretion system major pseudopilin GspG [Bacteriovoracales bacterium]
MPKQRFSIFSTIITSSRGLSLIEILIALTLMGVAATFIAGRVLDNLAEGEVKATKIQMANLSNLLKEFNRHCGFYPTTEQGLEALITKPEGRECKRYRSGGYLEDGADIPQDPWENDFQYTSDGRTFNIISLGRDGIEGGEEFDADISLKANRAEK